MTQELKTEAQRRGITRLCHFTPSRNLVQILSGSTGILATKKLHEDERSVYAQTDLRRLDGYLGHICCSVEFPNAWYFEKARGNEILFKDWVILFVDPKYLWREGTLFCPRNAASGRNVGSGATAFSDLFAERVIGQRGFSRTAQRLPCCPTDEQAEVLVPDCIALSDILGVAVLDEAQAKNELVRMNLAKVPAKMIQSLKFVIAPDLFDKYKLHQLLDAGKRPPETPYSPGGSNG